jgi:hypothetical protein
MILLWKFDTLAFRTYRNINAFFSTMLPEVGVIEDMLAIYFTMKSFLAC